MLLMHWPKEMTGSGTSTFVESDQHAASLRLVQAERIVKAREVRRAAGAPDVLPATRASGKCRLR
jgi:hypothetical protein